MKRQRELIVTDVLALVVLLVVFLIGWREAAAFGLLVLVMLNVTALASERWTGGVHHYRWRPFRNFLYLRDLLEKRLHRSEEEMEE